MPDHVEIQVTCGSHQEADAIADLLVESRLAACVHQIPIRSTYRWAGEIEHDDEILLLIKTRGALSDDVRRAVLAAHSYDVPQFTVVEIVGGSPEYLAWLEESTTAD